MATSEDKKQAWRIAVGRLTEEIALHRGRIRNAPRGAYGDQIREHATGQIDAYRAKQRLIREKLALSENEE